MLLTADKEIARSWDADPLLLDVLPAFQDASAAVTEGLRELAQIPVYGRALETICLFTVRRRSLTLAQVQKMCGITETQLAELAAISSGLVIPHPRDAKKITVDLEWAPRHARRLYDGKPEELLARYIEIFRALSTEDIDDCHAACNLFLSWRRGPEPDLPLARGVWKGVDSSP